MPVAGLLVSSRPALHATGRSRATAPAEPFAALANAACDWYALRTRHRHELFVARHLEELRIEAFLPRQQVVRKRKDRKVDILQPLFPGYLFVQPMNHQREDLRWVPGSCGVVAFRGIWARIDEDEISSVRRLVSGAPELSVLPALHRGQKVQVTRGALSGLVGELVEFRHGNRLVVNIESLHRSVSIQVAASDLTPAA